MENSKLAIFTILIAIMFPFFVYGFTTFGADYTIQDVTLSDEDLWRAGIMLGSNAVHNITFATGFTQYNLNETIFRVRWANNALILTPAGFQFRDFLDIDIRRDILGEGVLTTWLDCNVKGQWGGSIFNHSIVENWDPSYNWTRFQLQSGYEILITDPDKEGNITSAVYDDGIIQVTIGENLNMQEAIGLRNFVRWYSGLVLGTEDFGLPPFFQIIVRILTILSIFSVYLLIKDITPLIG